MNSAVEADRGAASLGAPPGRGHGWRSFVRGVAALSGGRIAAGGISAAWLVIAAHSLPVAAFGDLSVLLGIGMVADALGDMGYPLLISEAVARSGAISASTLRTVVRKRLGVGFGVGIGGALLYLAVAHDARLAIPALYGVSLAFTIVHSSISAAMRGLHSYRVEASNSVLSRVFVLLVGSAWLANGGGLAAAVAVYAIADSLSFVFIASAARRRLCRTDDGIDHKALLVRRNLHFGAGRVVSAVYNRADSWLVALLPRSQRRSTVRGPLPAPRRSAADTTRGRRSGSLPHAGRAG